MPFHTIMPAVRDGAVDAGLVIHEARFTYPRYGLHAVADLGDWWEGTTGLPIPLGAILARRDLAERTGVTPDELAGHVRASVRAAWADPDATRPYVAAHAQELEREVADAHIALYVNAFTEDLGDTGYAAVEALLGRAADAGLTPPLDRPLR
jgi:1,4-dihydroxy-6-naphthoate synthase